MVKLINENELNTRIFLNYKRLSESSYYQIDEIFSPIQYDWPGDKEGRALLSFVSHYKISGKKIACMSEMIKLLPTKLNRNGYLGNIQDNVFSEQQLSGHSWLLRGLCEYYEQFNDNNILNLARKITENLFIPTKGNYATYPIDRSTKNTGSVSGQETGCYGNWLLSSDIGCAFMSIDGLSHFYKLTKDKSLKELLDEMIDVYLYIDKAKLRAQTHCTLTAARGMLRMYTVTNEDKYILGAKKIYDLYVFGGGMTYTYQNLNWWSRPDSWTEPCAIVDSLMLSLELYKLTNEESYRKTAARIYHNGFATLQRDNGGAGTDTIVTEKSPWDYLKAQMYEAYFCCTMRLAEGLWYIKDNCSLLYAETVGAVKKDKSGIYRDGDIIYAHPDDSLLPYAESVVDFNGIILTPIVKYYRVPQKIIESAKQKILFK